MHFACNMQIQGVFSDVTAETMYDVIHDPVYRKTWDTQIIEGYDICRVNANSDIGYYSSKKHNDCLIFMVCSNILLVSDYHIWLLLIIRM